MNLHLLALPILFLFLSPPMAFSGTLTFLNHCNYTVWPAINSGAGTPPLSHSGFRLDPGSSVPISVPPSWSGRLWGRTRCSGDAGNFTCVTGDCGSSNVECPGGGAAPPVTLAEFTMNGAGGLDFYDVSLVDGFNLPMWVVPHGGTSGGNCSATGCVAELNESCPSELRAVEGGACVGCKSACESFGDEKYCCIGGYGTPETCGPTTYSEWFKGACPHAYSYAYDDSTSTFTCASPADYVITFCPSPLSSKKASNGPTLPSESSSMVSSNGQYLSSLTFTVMVIFITGSHLWR